MSLGFGFGFPKLRYNSLLWSPSLLTTALWLDAAETNTITLNNLVVSQWNDKSGNGRNVLQATSANQPLYVKAQNLIPYSERIDVANWTKVVVTASVNVITAPDGTLTAEKLEEVAATNFHMVRQSITVANNTQYTMSAYFKLAERKFVELAPFIGGVGGVGAYFNLETGAITNVAGTNWTVNNTLLTFVGDGWCRCSITFTTGTGGSGFVDYRLAPSAGVNNYAGTLGSGAYMWGAQLQTGTLSTYQRTEGAAITATAINNIPALSFDGVNDVLSLGATSLLNDAAGGSAFIVYRWRTVPSVAASVFVIQTGSASARYQVGNTITFGKFESAGRRLDADTYQIAAVSAQNIVALSANIQSTVITYSAALGQQFINGTLDGQNAAFQTAGNTSSTNSAGTFIGAVNNAGAQPAAVDIGELVFLNSAASTGDRQKLEGYLAWKWGLQADLPSDHPYKLSPPTI